MKKILLMSLILCMAMDMNAQDFIITDFEDGKTEYVITSGGGAAANCSAVVVDDPTGGDNKALKVQLFSTNAFPVFHVKLPEGKTLGDYRGFSMQVYLIDRGNGGNVQMYLGQWEDGDAPSRNATRGMMKINASWSPESKLDKWSPATYMFTDMNVSGNLLTDADKAMNEFNLAYGLAVSRGCRYFIKDIKLIE